MRTPRHVVYHPGLATESTTTGETMPRRQRFLPAIHTAALATCLVFAVGSVSSAQTQPEPTDYQRDIVPLFKKYCTGCHRGPEPEADLSLETYASIMSETPSGRLIVPGDPDASRLWLLVSAAEDPIMPPEYEPAPTPEEMELLKRWIQEGAHGPENETPDPLAIQLPEIVTRTSLSPITALAFSPRDDVLAIGRFGSVEFVDSSTETKPNDVRRIEGLPGKVNAIHFFSEGNLFVTASGIDGAVGQATIWEYPSLRRVRDFTGHHDILFDAEVSPDGAVLATCSYDQSIRLWDAATGEELHLLTGHNGAVYDIDFSPDGSVLASASADDTCKLWRVRDGLRLDTLSQPLKESKSVLFLRDGSKVLSGGADNSIRVWEFISREEPEINPPFLERFAHEAPIIRMGLTPDGTCLVTLSEDRTIKIWDTLIFSELNRIEEANDFAMALAVHPDGQRFAIGRLDGTFDTFPLPNALPKSLTMSGKTTSTPAPKQESGDGPRIDEIEPNNQALQAQPMSAPGRVAGVIDGGADQVDEDFFRFSAQAGEEWVIEVNADRSGSKLDSIIEVLTEQGEPITRVLLEAVRDSYFTFRGKDGNQTDDFRLFNWEEMRLNQFLYANGEVVKLWRYPRGPDSGYDVYPGSGQRWNYYDSMGLTHALNEPCYVVVPRPPESKIPPSGLPIYRVTYMNDDESRRSLGTDSRLFFVAPETANYVVRLRDVRGSQGPDFTYELSIRTRRPDFKVAVVNPKLQAIQGRSAEVALRAERFDQFDEPITIEITGAPEGYEFLNPTVIEKEQLDAFTLLKTASDAPDLTAEEIAKIELVGKAWIQGKEREFRIPAFSEITFAQPEQFQATILASAKGPAPIAGGGDAPLEFVMRPGEVLTLKVAAERNGFNDDVTFGNEDSGRNLPHGVYVSDIGLNGLRLLSNESERDFFITADPGVPDQTRHFHLKVMNKPQTTSPVILHIRGSGVDGDLPATPDVDQESQREAKPSTPVPVP